MTETTITSGAHSITVKPKTITMRTHAEMLAWKEKLAQRAAATGQTGNVELVLTLIKSIPELGSLITATGDFNAATVRSMAQNYKGMTEAEAEEAAKAEIQQRILGIAADSPDVAKALFFPDIKIGYDPESIAICIDCLRQTFDTNSVSKAELKLLSSMPDSDFYQDMSWEGLVAYAEKFCQLFK